MSSSTSSRKRTAKISSEVTEPYDLFYQLSYMATTAAAGIPSRRIFELAKDVDSQPAKFFGSVDNLTDKLRYTYPDACRMIGTRLPMGDMRTFMLRLADAVRSGEPLPAFLAREAQVQGERFSNGYASDLESLKKWDDGYTSVTISVALVVVINMVSTMIYDLGMSVMAGMAFGAIIIGFAVAWVLSRAAPHEVLTVPWGDGSRQQKLTVKLAKILCPIAVVVAIVLGVLGLGAGWPMVIAGLIILPVGISANKAQDECDKEEAEISAFFRSLGGTATSQGTTLGQALETMELASFPTMRSHITRLSMRLRAGAKPITCWRLFGRETGSLLIEQSANMFFDATNMGGDAEECGGLCSMFTNEIAMLRARRKGVAGTFLWLTLVMHTVVTALLYFILEILRKFIDLMQSAASFDMQEEEMRQMAMDLMSFSTPQTAFLEQLSLALIVMMSLINAFAIVASEGTNLIKVTFYLAVMFIISGVGILIIPSLISGIL